MGFHCFRAHRKTAASFVFATTVALLSVVLCTGETSAQSSRSRSKSNDQAQAQANSIPGYTLKQIEGFNLLLSDATVAANEASKLERKPIEVLELELKTIVKLLPPEAVRVLRGLLIWVEWNEPLMMSNGRAGTAVAVYYGGHQLQMLAAGMHPLKAKNITILSMQSLTNEHQPSRDSGRCVILHEMTHAVHDQLFGRENPHIKAAYRIAMERKLYDPSMYAATNEAEFFAELTCSYFDQSSYHPRTNLELKAHDPQTYEMMERIWGRRKADTLATNSWGSEEEINLKLSEISLGRPLQTLMTSSSASFSHTGPLMVLYWNANSPSSLACLRKLNDLYTELREFGLEAVAVHLTGANGAGDILAAAESRGVTFKLAVDRWSEESLVKDFNDFPLLLIFNPAGNCVYRGSAFEAEKPLKATVGRALVESCGVEEFPRQLNAIVEGLTGGKTPSMVLAQLNTQTKSRDKEIAAAAQKLMDAILAQGLTRMENAQKLAETDPALAYLQMESLPVLYKGSTLAAEANTSLGKLRRDPAVAKELRARPILITIRKLDSKLSGRPGSFNPALFEFRRDNEALLSQLATGIGTLRREFSDTHAVKEAERIARTWGL